MMEMRYRCTAVAAWLRAYYSAGADFVTRCSDEEFGQWIGQHRLTIVDIGDNLHQAVEDSEKFGPCLLAWDIDDREELLRIKERRIAEVEKNDTHRVGARLGNPSSGRTGGWVLGFTGAAKSFGCDARMAGWSGPVGHDETGSPWKSSGHSRQGSDRRQSSFGISRRPRAVDWSRICDEFVKAGWQIFEDEFNVTQPGWSLEVNGSNP